MRASLKNAAVIGVICVIVIGGLVLSTTKVQRYRYRPYLHDTLYLPTGKFVKELALGYRQVASDLIWLSAIQYYGEYRQEKHDLAYFKGLIDIITTLDPQFVFAYIFGAMVVSEDTGEFEEGTAILKKGMAANPTSWELPFEIGFLNFANRVDYKVAGRYFDLASRMPGAPERSRRFAAFVYSKAGETGSSIELWEKYIEYTDNPYLKEMAESYIAKLKAEQGEGGDR